MRCVHHSAFWFATFASSLFGFATFLPLWLGRRREDGFRFYALWYQLLCQDNSCSSLELMFQNKHVEGDYGFQLVVLPMCALIAAVCSFLGVIMLEILSCDCGRKVNCNPRPVIVACTIFFWIAGVFSGLALFLSIVICIEFFRADTIDHAGEFPWCSLMFGIGFVLMTIAAAFYTVIVCRWSEYGPFYGFIDWRTLDYVDNLNTGSYHRSPSIRDKTRYLESIRRNYPDNQSLRESLRSFNDSPMLSRGGRKNVPGFAFGGLPSFSVTGKEREDYERKFRSTGDGSLFDYKLKNSKRASSFSDLRESKKRSIHDSPKILRQTHASQYIQEERNSLRESKRLNRAVSMDEIDPKRLQTGYTAYRESRFDTVDEPKFPNFTQANRNSSRESRKLKRAVSMDEIDPKQLKTGYTAYRESRLDKMDGAKFTDTSPAESRSEMSIGNTRHGDINILDILYRESRKANV